MPEFFPVCLELLEVEEGQKHQLFVVLKSIPYLAKNVVQNVAVELVVVCASVSFRRAPRELRAVAS